MPVPHASLAPRTPLDAGTGRRDRLLPTVLLVDAGVTGLNGAAYLAGAALLDDVLGLPADALRGVGVLLLGFALAVGAVARRAPVNPPAVRAVVAANAGWVAASTAAAVAGWAGPTTLGTVWIALQAAVVAGFAVLQWAGLRSAPLVPRTGTRTGAPS
jgi:hypothetical protein